MSSIIGSMIIALGSIYIFSFSYLIFYKLSGKNDSRRKYNPYDDWDEPDGSTYIVLPNGDRRLD